MVEFYAVVTPKGKVARDFRGRARIFVSMKNLRESVNPEVQAEWYGNRVMRFEAVEQIIPKEVK